MIRIHLSRLLGEHKEKIAGNAGIRAKVEHPFLTIKRQFGFVKVRYCGLKKNTDPLFTLFASSNLWMMCGKLMDAKACVRPKTGFRN